ncbi:MAG: hypothetical protein EAZ55_14230 [Cytophagales bacterium]|nr:MAG: hypothetical protein EAZ55_14230 [Cytophagales bacterium]
MTYFEEIYKAIGHLPYINKEKSLRLYTFIREKKPKKILELGTAYGKSACIMAAALKANGMGTITTVDLMHTSFQPTVEYWAALCGVEKHLQANKEHNSYNWFLKKEIEKQTKKEQCQPLYDFCFIDGAKHWTTDGMAFFLVDKLLKEEGWLLFDDYSWTFAHSGKNVSDGISIRNLGEEELNTPHIQLIFELLVKQHPDYEAFKVEDNEWAWARKKAKG